MVLRVVKNRLNHIYLFFYFLQNCLFAVLEICTPGKKNSWKVFENMPGKS